MTSAKISASSHHEYLFDHRAFTSKVEITLNLFKKIRTSTAIDAIAFRGMSGASMGFILGYQTGVPMLFVRKGEQCYSSQMSEGVKGNLKYLIVDDLICSGKTVRDITMEINSFGGTVVGVILYNEGAKPHYIPREDFTTGMRV